MGLIINSYSFGGYTARTTAFLAATGITDTTIANALNTMDLALIANGLDTKMNALYPFVGGTATTHKFNFMNAVDSDAAFRLTFSGGWAHSSTGALPNGSTGYANTYLTPSTLPLSLTSNHLSYYSRTNNTTGAVDCGATNVSSYWDIEIYFGAVLYGGLMTTAYMSAAATRSDRLYINSRTASNAASLYRNGASQVTSSTVGTALPTVPVYLGARDNSNSPDFYSNRECSFASIGLGLSSTDATNLTNLVTTFQTSLSRNV